MKINQIPTGFLFTDEYSRGQLETLSIGDYGKQHNIKADFLGFTNEINGVGNGVCMPLSEKWVITLSTQYGCKQNCHFCLLEDAPILMSDYTYKKIVDVQMGDVVIANKIDQKASPKSQDYLSKHTKLAYVNGLIKRQYEGLIYTLTLENGEKFQCTSHHLIPHETEIARIKFSEVDVLKIGDTIYGMRKILDMTNDDSWKLGWLQGFMNGDGVYDVSKDNVRRCFIAQNDKSMLEFAISICNGLGVKSTNIWKNGEKNHRFGILGKNLIMLQNIFETCQKSDTFKKGYVAGYWDAEGYSLKNTTSYRVCDSDINMLNIVKTYLTDLGYPNYSVYEEEPDNPKHKKMYNLFSKSLNRAEFVSLFSPLHKKKYFLDDQSTVMTFIEKMKIINIETSEYNGLVYNIETTEHTYVCGTVLSHNCDVPNVKFNGNATFEDLHKQFISAIMMFPGQKYTDRLNLHFARMGEPIYNKNVFEYARWLYANKKQIHKETGLRIETLHPVLTTSLPKKLSSLKSRILEWCDIKNTIYNGQAGLQFSINSTNEEQRKHMFNDGSITLEELSEIAKDMPEPVGRKYCLNFAYASDYEVDGEKLRKLFDPEKFMCKITPIHNNSACTENGIETIDGYEEYTPYRKPEQELIKAGFDVLVFVPSMDEEDGLVTCGNLVLSNSKEVKQSDIIKIVGV